MSDKNYELLYYYDQLGNDGNLTIRLPQELKKDFLEAAGNSRNSGKLIREFMIQYISNHKK